MSQMIEVKTAELTGDLLDCLVATIENPEEKIFYNSDGYTLRWHKKPPKFSTDWATGGPLLDRHCKSFGCVQDGRYGTWRAFGYGKGEAFDPNRTMNLASGPSILIAACRAIVKAKLGDTVTVPAELLP